MASTPVTIVSPAPLDALAPKTKQRFGLLGAAWGTIRGYRSRAVYLAGLGLVSAQAETVGLVSIALLLEAAATGDTAVSLDIPLWTGSISTIAAATVAFAGIAGAAVLTLIQGVIAAHGAAALGRQYRDDLVRRIASADWEYQSQQQVSRVVGRLRLTEAAGMIFSTMHGYLRSLTAVVVFVATAVAINIAAAGIMLAVGAIFSLAVYPLRRRSAELAAEKAQLQVSLNDEVVDALDQGADAVVFGAWPKFEGRFFAKSAAVEKVRAQISIVASRAPVAYQYGALALLLMIVVLVSGLGAVESVGAFAASGLLLLRSVQYGQAVQTALHRLSTLVPDLDRLKLESVVPPPRVTTGDEPMSGISALELRNVDYEYPGADVPVLHDVSVRLSAGTVVGIAGPSGSGKTTLGQVLMRLRWPTGGSYHVNDRDAAVYADSAWQSVVAHVPQSPRLLDGTLRDNVTYFDDSIDTADVAAALEAVGLGDLLRTLPHGLETTLRHSGMSLSGGQVQRLGIARVLARRARFVVLDEPTSALDVDSEAMVREALAALSRIPHTLIVVIAHRPSTLKLCDHILVMHAGHLEDSGPMQEVLDRNPFLMRLMDGGPRSPSPALSSAEN